MVYLLMRFCKGYRRRRRRKKKKQTKRAVKARVKTKLSEETPISFISRLLSKQFSQVRIIKSFEFLPRSKMLCLIDNLFFFF